MKLTPYSPLFLTNHLVFSFFLFIFSLRISPKPHMQLLPKFSHLCKSALFFLSSCGFSPAHNAEFQCTQFCNILLFFAQHFVMHISPHSCQSGMTQRPLCDIISAYFCKQFDVFLLFASILIALYRQNTLTAQRGIPYCVCVVY